MRQNSAVRGWVARCESARQCIRGWARGLRRAALAVALACAFSGPALAGAGLLNVNMDAPPPVFTAAIGGTAPAPIPSPLPAPSPVTNRNRTLEIVDAWAKERFDSLLVVPSSLGRNLTCAVKIKIDADAWVPVPVPALDVVVHEQHALALDRTPDGIYRVHLEGESGVGAGADVELAKLAKMGILRTMTTHAADPAKPGQMSRLLWLLTSGGQQVPERFAEEVARRIPSGVYARLAGALGTTVRVMERATGQAQGALGAIEASPVVRGTESVMASGLLGPLAKLGADVVLPATLAGANRALAGQRVILNRAAMQADFVGQLAQSFRDAPPLESLFVRAKFEVGQLTTARVEAKPERIDLEGVQVLGIEFEPHATPPTVSYSVRGTIDAEISALPGKAGGQISGEVRLVTDGHRPLQLTMTFVRGAEAVASVAALGPEAFVGAGGGLSGLILLTSDGIARPFDPQIGWKNHLASIFRDMKTAVGTPATLPLVLGRIFGKVTLALEGTVKMVLRGDAEIASHAELSAEVIGYATRGGIGGAAFDRMFMLKD